MKREEVLAYDTMAQQHMKKQFWLNDDPRQLVTVKIVKDKRYGARAILSIFDFHMGDIPDHIIKKINKRAKRREAEREKYFKKYGREKPIYTKNWKKVDETSIRVQVVKNIFRLILLEDTTSKIEAAAIIGALLWIINSRVPPRWKGPISFVSYGICGIGYEDLTCITNFLNAPDLKNDPSYKYSIKRSGEYRKMPIDKIRELMQVYRKGLEGKMIVKNGDPQ